ncbi:MAG: flippase [Patescibacteria group bacterium]|nr:flippase [Patescibacteria group bacterium]
MTASSYHPDRIARNTSYLTLALAIQKVLSFAYFIYISRAVGHEELGKYLFALSVTTIFGIFIDIGLNSVLTREIAKDPEKTSTYLNTTFSLKLLTSLAAYGAVIVFINILGYPEVTKQLVYLSGLVMILDSFTLSFYAIFRGHQILKYESIGVIINKVVVIGVGVLGVLAHRGVKFLILAILFGSLFNVIYTLILLLVKIRWRPAFFLNRAVLKTLLRIALPFAVASIFITVFAYIDTVLLNIMGGARGDSYVGWYGTAYKLTYAFQFIPLALAAAVFPAMSSYFVVSRGLLARTFERAIYYLTVISVPIALGVFAIADKLIITIWGKAFEASIAPLRILVFSLIFLFASYPVGSLLNACNRQTRNTVNMGIAMVVNIILNVILIPHYTFIGTSIASLVAVFVLFVSGFIVVRQIIDYDKKFLLKTLFKTLLSGGIMLAVMMFLKPGLSVMLLIPIGIAVYFAVLFLVRGFGHKEYVRIYHSVMTKLK